MLRASICVYVPEFQLKSLYILLWQREICVTVRNFNFPRTITTIWWMHEILLWRTVILKVLELCRVTDNIKFFGFRYLCSIKIARWRPFTEYKEHMLLKRYMATVRTCEGISELFNVCRICTQVMSSTQKIVLILHEIPCYWIFHVLY
jgi:hypothetical protein